MEKYETPRTREGMIAQCRASDPEGKNRAIQRHIKKLQAMSEYDYEIHRLSLVEMRKRAAPSVARMVREVVDKTR